MGVRGELFSIVVSDCFDLVSERQEHACAGLHDTVRSGSAFSGLVYWQSPMSRYDTFLDDEDNLTKSKMPCRRYRSFNFAHYQKSRLGPISVAEENLFRRLVAEYLNGAMS